MDIRPTASQAPTIRAQEQNEIQQVSDKKSGLQDGSTSTESTKAKKLTSIVNEVFKTNQQSKIEILIE